MTISFSLTDFPLIHSVANELDAMAEPQPKVLNLASVMFPLSSTSILGKTQMSINFSYIANVGYWSFYLNGFNFLALYLN